MKCQLFFCTSLFFLLFTTGFRAHAQDLSREELEQRRMELKQEILKINSLLVNTKEKEKSVLSEVRSLNRRIEATENLIAVINQEANLLNRKINVNIRKIEKLLKELKELKADYAKMIVRSRRSSSQQNRLMFLFSSQTFMQAYRRLQYMKQYAEYRKEQGLHIKDQTAVLQVLNENLLVQKNEKENLLEEKKLVREKLKDDKEAQQVLMASINKKESQFKKQIQEKQAQINKINDQIDALIRAAIVTENKKKGSDKKNEFELTPEAKALAADFKSNKGKLPWPVKSGIVVMSFGKHPHPVINSVYINSNGVRIQTEENASAKAVFNGVVSKVQSLRGAHMAVMIRHGDYLTIYQNLTSVSVETGDEVQTGQVLGKVGKSTATGEATLYFFVFKNTDKLNPADWIYKM